MTFCNFPDLQEWPVVPRQPLALQRKNENEQVGRDKRQVGLQIRLTHIFSMPRLKAQEKKKDKSSSPWPRSTLHPWPGPLQTPQRVWQQGGTSPGHPCKEAAPQLRGKTLLLCTTKAPARSLCKVQTCTDQTQSKLALGLHPALTSRGSPPPWPLAPPRRRHL